MEQAVFRNNKGFTLLEALIAIVLLSIMMLGALTGLIASYKSTSLNALRDEGVKLAQELVNDERNTPYTSHVLGTTTQTYQRQVSNAAVTYTVQKTVSDVSLGLIRSVQLVVSWPHKGLTYTYTSTAIIGVI